MKSETIWTLAAGTGIGVVLGVGVALNTVSNPNIYPMMGGGMMMGRGPIYGSISNEEVLKTQKEEQEGEVIFKKLQNKTLAPQALGDKELEKLGEFDMGRRIGNTPSHAQRNKMLKNMEFMMGYEVEEQTHINLGRSVIEREVFNKSTP